MNSRERIKRAFNHKEIDRVPMDFGGTIVTSLTKSAYIKLLKYLNIDYVAQKIEIIDYTMGTVIPDESILKKLYVDFRRIGINTRPQIIDNRFKNANIAIVNQAFNNNEGLGLLVKFNKNNLPYLTQWKHLEKGEYVCGIEPCNSFVRGRTTERKEKNLQFIEPGEQKSFKLEFNILRSNNDISKFKDTYLI